VINWCLSLRLLDGVLVGAKESLKVSLSAKEYVSCIEDNAISIRPKKFPCGENMCFCEMCGPTFWFLGRSLGEPSRELTFCVVLGVLASAFLS
jgi:hypothetical protein